MKTKQEIMQIVVPEDQISPKPLKPAEVVISVE